MVETDLIAVVGMSVRFPGALNYKEFWNNLYNGVVSITDFSESDLLASGVSREDLEDTSYVRSKPLLHDIDQFDPGFFGFSEQEATLTDPQHRVFLEIAWEAFEDAGYRPSKDIGNIGVFVGSGKNTYLVRNLLSSKDWARDPEVFQLLIGNEKDYLATRVASLLDAQGPAVNIQTACSSSLVAVHFACQSLLAGECDFAIAGGVSIGVPNVEGYRYYPNGILSPNGRCWPFSTSAAGTVFGDGAAAVVLRRAEDASRDSVRAIIRGSAVNNDGRRRSFPAPSENGQVRVITEALAIAEVEPEQIGFIEAHGTATVLGDEIELNALKKAFGNSSPTRIPIGSVKSNIGHSGAAAGIAGLCKAILAREHGAIPPSPHDDSLNYRENTRGMFYLSSAPTPWPSSSPCASISSFGQGGTNAHIVIDLPISSRRRPSLSSGLEYYPLMLSARSQLELDDVTEKLIATLTDESHSLADISWTLFGGRYHFNYRRVVLARTCSEAREFLSSKAPSNFAESHVFESSPEIDFVIPEVDQIIDCGLSIFPEYKSAYDNCLALHSFSERESVQVALAMLWISWGLKPREVKGEGTRSKLADFIQQRKGVTRTPRSMATFGRNLQFEVSTNKKVAGLLRGVSTGDRLQASAVASLFAQLWLLGVELSEYSSFFSTASRRVPLPTYPFRRRQIWREAPEQVASKQKIAKHMDSTESDVKIVQQVFQEVLGLGDVPPNADFFEYGGSSLSTIVMATKIEKKFGMKLEYDFIHRYRTPETIALALNFQTSHLPETHLAESDIEAYVPYEQKTVDGGQAIFMTGSTGFLGIHVLEALMSNPNRRIFCLVRGESDADCRSRIQKVANFYRCNVNAHSPRLRLYCGDVGSPKLGLSNRDLEEIVEESSIMFHSAAVVNFLSPYSEIRGVNVCGTREMIEIADRRKTPLHIASSIAVFESIGSSEHNHVIKEDDMVSNINFKNGYDLSKWVVEKMAGKRVSPTFVHRLSNIIPHSKRGIIADDQILVAFLRSCIKIGLAPGENDHINVIHVDIAASWIANLIVKDKVMPGSYHILHPHPLPIAAVVSWLRTRGHAVEFCDESTWRDRIAMCPDIPFYPYLPLIDGRSLFSNRLFDMTNTIEALGESIVPECPSVDGRFFDLLYSQLQS